MVWATLLVLVVKLLMLNFVFTIFLTLLTFIDAHRLSLLSNLKGGLGTGCDGKSGPNCCCHFTICELSICEDCWSYEDCGCQYSCAGESQCCASGETCHNGICVGGSPSPGPSPGSSPGPSPPTPPFLGREVQEVKSGLCTSAELIASADDCQAAAIVLGLGGKVVTGSWSGGGNPPGCNWRNNNGDPDDGGSLWFNRNKASTTACNDGTYPNSPMCLCVDPCPFGH